MYPSQVLLPPPSPTSPPEPPPKRCFDILNAALPWAAPVLPHFRLLSLHHLCGLQHLGSQHRETVSRGHWWPNSLARPWASGMGHGHMAIPNTGFSLLVALDPSLHQQFALCALCSSLLIFVIFPL